MKVPVAWVVATLAATAIADAAEPVGAESGRTLEDRIAAVERLTSGPVSGYQQLWLTKKIDPNMEANVEVICPTGKRVVGGGFSISGNVKVIHNRPSGSGKWQAVGQNAGATLASISAYAICVNAVS